MSKTGSLVRRTSGSVFLCTLVLFVVVNFALAWIKPLQFVRMFGFIPLEQNPFVSKLPKFLNSNEHPDILVLGSSLPMEAIARYDSVFAGLPKQDDLTELRKYSKAVYLEHLIEARFGKHVTTSNLTCVACMASDASFILRKTIEAGKTPKLVVYGIGPRDFIDNYAPPPGKSPVCKILSDRLSLGDFTQPGQKIEDGAEAVAEAACYLYKVRADYSAFLSNYVQDSMHKPAQVQHNKAKQPVTVAKAKPVEVDQFSDLPEWKKRYFPPNFPRFEYEKRAFRQLLQLCQKNHINMIVVNMPLTQQNKNLIAPLLLSRYESEICALPHQYAASFVDLDGTRSFTLSDFYDSAHASPQGGKKVQDLLIGSIGSLPL